MNFILKKLGRKVISVICAIAIMLSVITVAFGTLAADTSAVDPYVVKMSSPAIPMTSLTKINLDNIDVVFPEDNLETDGTEINWAIADPAETKVELKGTELIAYAKGTAKLTATKKSGGDSVAIYAVIKDPADTTWDIYSIDFTAVDDEYSKLGYVNVGAGADYITYNGTAISASNPAPAYPAGWQAYYVTNASGTKQVRAYHTVMPYTYNDGTALKTVTGIVPFMAPADLYSLINWGNQGYFVLNNETVNAFSDYTVTTNFITQGGQSQNSHTKFLLAGRVALNSDGTPKLDADTSITSFGIQLHGTCSYSGHDTVQVPDAVTYTSTLGAEPTVNISTANASAATTQVWNTSEMIGVTACLKHQGCGNAKNERNITLSVKYNGTTATLYSPNDTSGASFTIESAQNSGAVAFVQNELDTWGRQTTSNLQYFKVTLNNDPSNPADYPAYSTDIGVYIVKAASPAIPMTSLTQIDLNNVAVEIDGNIVFGKNINWSVENKAGIELNGMTLGVLKKGTYKVTATLKSDPTVSETIYAVVKDPTDTTWDIYSIDFTAVDDDYANLGYVDNGATGDYITYNGTAVSATNPAPAYPTGWQSYYSSERTSDTGVDLFEFSNPFPYANASGTALNVTSGIMPFAEPTDLDYQFSARWGSSGYFVLNNEVVNAFTNYTVQTNFYAYNFRTSGNSFGILGRVQLNETGEIYLDSSTTINGIGVDLGGYHPGHTPVLSVVKQHIRTNHRDTASNAILISNLDVSGTNEYNYSAGLAHSQYNHTKSGVNVLAAVRYDGNTATFYSPADTSGEVYTVTSAETTGAVGVFMSDLRDWDGGTSSWMNVQSFKVSLNNDPTNPADYPAYTVIDRTFYEVKAESPAIPMYAGSYISTEDLLVIDNAGNRYLGNEFTYTNKTGGNGIEIDNANNKITAYVKGTYELEAKTADGTTLTLYAVVKNKGDATWDIYNIDFTEYSEDMAKLGYVNSADDVSDYVTYNGEKVSASNQPKLPAEWTSYYIISNTAGSTANEKARLNVKKSEIQAFPYTNSDGGEMGVKTGIVPFGNPKELGLTTAGVYGGYYVLNNKTVNAFTNLTVTVDMYNYNSSTGPSRFEVGARVALDSNGELKFGWGRTTTINTIGILPGANCNYSGHVSNKIGKVYAAIRDNHAHGSDYPGAEYAVITSGTVTDSSFSWNYTCPAVGCNNWACGNSKSGANYVLSVRYDGNTATLSSPNDSEGKTFTVASAPSTGGIAIAQISLTKWDNGGKNSWTNIQSVKVSLNNADGDCPPYTSFGYFLTKDNSYVYGSEGDEIILSDVMAQMGDGFATGDTLNWSSDSSNVTITADKIILRTKGTADVTATDGTNSLDITFAIKGADEEFFSNGNYDFSYSDGVITAINRLDTGVPYSAEVIVPDRITHSDGSWTNIYEISASMGLNSGAYNSNIEKATIGKYIEKIGANAFENATELTTVELPERLIEIGANAFKNTALTEVVIPVRVDKIGDGAFADCGALTKVYIGNPDIEIGAGAFSANTVVYGPAAIKEKVEAAGGQFAEMDAAEVSAAASERARILAIEANRVNTVDTEALYFAENKGGTYGWYITKMIAGNRDAGKYVITDGMTVVDTKDGQKKAVDVGYITSCFTSSPDKLRVLSIEVGEGVNNYSGTFAGLSGLLEIKLPDNFAVGYRTFQNCTSLKSVTIPAGAELIGMELFTGCSSLEEIIFTDNSQATLLGCNIWADTPGAFMNGTKVSSINLPVTVTKLTPSVFGSTAINKITITNKDLVFTTTTDNKGNVNDRFFPNGTVVYGVAGSTAEIYVNETKAKYGYSFVAIDDYFVTNANTVDSNAKFTAELTDGTYYAITDYIGVGGKIIIPSFVNSTDGVKNAPIYAVSSKIFHTTDGTATGNIQRLINLEISEGIYEIDEDAFKGATHLESVKLPTSLKVIGKTAFATTGIKGTVEIPKNVVEIGAGAFQGATGITDVYIYNAAAVIKGNAFEKTVKIHGIAGSTAEKFAETYKVTFVSLDGTDENPTDSDKNPDYTGGVLDPVDDPDEDDGTVSVKSEMDLTIIIIIVIAAVLIALLAGATVIIIIILKSCQNDEE